MGYECLMQSSLDPSRSWCFLSCCNSYKWLQAMGQATTSTWWRPYLPQKATWWRVGVALQCGVLGAEQEGQDGCSTGTKGVSHYHQPIVHGSLTLRKTFGLDLYTHTHTPFNLLFLLMLCSHESVSYANLLHFKQYAQILSTTLHTETYAHIHHSCTKSLPKACDKIISCSSFFLMYSAE